MRFVVVRNTFERVEYDEPAPDFGRGNAELGGTTAFEASRLDNTAGPIGRNGEYLFQDANHLFVRVRTLHMLVRIQKTPYEYSATLVVESPEPAKLERHQRPLGPCTPYPFYDGSPRFDDRARYI